MPSLNLTGNATVDDTLSYNITVDETKLEPEVTYFPPYDIIEMLFDQMGLVVADSISITGSSGSGTLAGLENISPSFVIEYTLTAYHQNTS